MIETRSTITATADAQVTVGMPVFNNERTLQRAIDSVRAQSFGGWRLIISDDCSSDGTARIAEAAAAKDDRIGLVRQKKQLGFMNFRVPLDQAETPYFAWLAGDDYWHPDFLAETSRALNAAPAALSALPQAAFVGPPERAVPDLGFLKGDAAGRVRRYLVRPGGTRMYGLMRTTTLKTACPTRPFHAYDWYLMVALLAEGPQLSLPQTLLFREETPWWRYAHSFAAETRPGIRRGFPILDMSLQLIRDRRIPIRALPALLRLNLHKHEEVVAVADPDKWRRRRWVYKKLGLTIANSPKLQADLAARLKPITAGAIPAAPVRVVKAQAQVTAILAFRNAGATLAAALDHLESLGCAIIAIDHGSTDNSRAIAEARRAGCVAKIIDERWTGFFDLQRQLALKQEVVASLPPGWVLHADADEFIDPPEDQSLAECLAAADADGRIAFDCAEDLFVPLFEDEQHDPDTFTKTMTARVRMREHNRKQRLFRSDADLGLWWRTAGHTVTREPRKIADKTLMLRHYPGLSLDHLRSQYYARVFLPDNCARLWHSNRMAARLFDIVEPDPSLFTGAAGIEVRNLPFFAPRRSTDAAPLPESADLYLLGAETAPDAEAKILAALPGLRIGRVGAGSLVQMTRMRPVLNVVTHPARLHGHGVQRSIERSRATAWTRDIALARQWAADRNAAYAEVRSEDLAKGAGALRPRLIGLWHTPVLRGADGFIGPDAAAIRVQPWEDPVRAITAPLAADLGYT
ncbi:glycosyltransferase [Tabrizicola sp.]|uniref:glycosyltransferase n=1 Tax=Tabrizicola sp. TaxID=2005166 RepID=UPI003F2C22F9